MGVVVVAIVQAINALLGWMFGLFGVKPRNVPPPGDPSIGSSWMFQYSPGMPMSPITSQGGVEFTFPMADGVHYLVNTGARSVDTGMRAVIEIVGDNPVFTYPGDTGDPGEHMKPTCRLYMQRRGATTGASGGQEFYRIWHPGTITKLQPGVFELVAPMNPAEWTGVWGTNNPQMVAAAMADLQAVGITFGGGGMAGHGVFLKSGSARFYIRKFEVS